MFDPLVPLNEARVVNGTTITGGTPVKVMVKVAVPVPPVLVALIVALKVPETDGVPLIRPVVVLTLRPVGNPLAA
jgi:hypothetical protein